MITGGVLTAITLALVLTTGTVTEAYPNKTDDCSRCHGPGPGTYFEDIMSITVSKTLLAPGEEYLVGIDLVIQTELSKQDTGYAIQSIDTGDWLVWSSNQPVSHYDQTMTAPTVPGTYSYRVWGQSGPATNDGKADYDDYTIVVEESSSTEFVLTLVEGWNFVSIPLTNHGYMASTLGLALGDLVAGWDSAAQTYTQGYIVGLSPTSSDFAVDYGVGYWVYVSAPTTLLLQGDLPTSSQTFELSVPSGGGWVALGLMSTSTGWMASDIPLMFSVSGSIAMVADYDPTTQSYNAYLTGVPFTDYPLAPGEAYWVWCGESGTISYDP